MRTVFGTAAVALALGACEESATLLPGVGNDPGSGTGTLSIDGVVTASPKRFNASASSDFDTEFSLRVSRAGRPVPGAAVAIASASGKVPLTYQTGRWTGATAAYDEVYTLDVAVDDDRVDAVRLDGPDIHVFTHPAAGATISLAMAVTLAWKRREAADAAEVRTDTTDWIEISDSGSYTLPGGAIRPDTKQPLAHTLRLARTNRITPAGAVTGSTWSVVIENRLSVNTEAQPPL